MKNIKTFESFRQTNENEQINEDYIEHPPADVILEKMKKALPELAKQFKKDTGVNFKLDIKVNYDRFKNPLFTIFSNDLLNEFGKLGKTMFSEIKLEFWGGDLLNKEAKVWINPKISYEHPGGGSNGTDFLYDSFWFDYEEEKWIFGRKLI